ncbi:hypothetical protein [Calycomorphotria hydatis]|nr:hypothetical protein [Calycomorphotria hydatis]
MTTHHADIYHCQKCGHVIAREHVDQTPVCCGETMVLAVSDLVYKDNRDDVGTVDEVVDKSHEKREFSHNEF